MLLELPPAVRGEDLDGGAVESQGPAPLVLGRHVPVGRLGRPEDVASMVRYLVSEEAGFVTGQTLNVNGGLLL